MHCTISVRCSVYEQIVNKNPGVSTGPVIVNTAVGYVQVEIIDAVK